MFSELDFLLDVTCRLEEAGLEYMLTGSMALNHYAQPRMTRDIDIVLAFNLNDLEKLPQLFGEYFYYSEEAARDLNPQSVFLQRHPQRKPHQNRLHDSQTRRIPPSRIRASAKDQN